MKPTAPKHPLRFRQVHLDFHTSGDIRGIGRRFSKRQFQEALKRGRVNSITLFAKCHHGWSYHPTKVGARHPHLGFDLLQRQIDACREIDVRCPIYLSAGIDERMAKRFPDWLVRQRDGSTSRPFEDVGFRLMRMNSPYLDYLCDQIGEVVQRWPKNDGIFLDIIKANRDYSEDTLRAMRALGLNPEIEAEVDAYGQQVLRDYYRRTSAAARSANPATPLFHNGGHVPVGAHWFNRHNSHYELESLPTGGWSYDHFAVSARYAATQDRDFLGMTGKFHTTWGEFGGFKRAAALRYECAVMLAYGAKCSVGDQLHPDGKMNPDTYRLIGEAFAEVEAREPWCDGARPVVKIAIASAETRQALARGSQSASRADGGAARMLLELHLPFVVLDEDASWDGFDLVVMPDTLVLSAPVTAKAQRFLHAGGKILAAGSALLDPDHQRFALDPGARLLGHSKFDPDFLVATPLSANVPVRTPVVIHGGAYEIEPRSAEILARRRAPFFNRTWKHFCSHQHAPDSGASQTPAATVSRSIAYFAHNIFSGYRELGQPLHRDFVLAAIIQLLGGELPVTTTLPTDGRFGLMEQRAERRYLAHLLYAPKSLRGTLRRRGRETPIEIIEDLVSLRDTRVTLRIPRRIVAAKLVPQDQPLAFTQKDGVVEFTVEAFTGHQMVELRYA